MLIDYGSVIQIYNILNLRMRSNRLYMVGLCPQRWNMDLATHHGHGSPWVARDIHGRRQQLRRRSPWRLPAAPQLKWLIE